MELPRIKRTAELVTTAAGDIYVLRPTDDSDLRIEPPDAAARSLLTALDGTRTLGELEREFGSEPVRDTLTRLSDVGLLDDAADDARVSAREAARYDRQLRYFSDVSSGPLPPSEHQRRLREARVLMLGVGGLGSWASYALVCCQEQAYRDGFPLYDELVEERRGRPSEAATLGPVCAFIGGQVALETLHQLTGLVPPASLGVAYVYDLRTMEVSREPVPGVDGCAVCGT